MVDGDANGWMRDVEAIHDGRHLQIDELFAWMFGIARAPQYPLQLTLKPAHACRANHVTMPPLERERPQ